MKQRKGIWKGLLIAAGVFAVALIAAVFTFLFASDEESEPESTLTDGEGRFVPTKEKDGPHGEDAQQDTSSNPPPAPPAGAVSETALPAADIPGPSAEPALSEPAIPADTVPDNALSTADIPVLPAEPKLSEPTPSSNSLTRVWKKGCLLGSTDSDKYHSRECMAARKITPEKTLWFEDEDAAKKAGYRLCGICGRNK